MSKLYSITDQQAAEIETDIGYIKSINRDLGLATVDTVNHGQLTVSFSYRCECVENVISDENAHWAAEAEDEKAYGLGDLVVVMQIPVWQIVAYVDGLPRYCFQCHNDPDTVTNAANLEGWPNATTQPVEFPAGCPSFKWYVTDADGDETVGAKQNHADWAEDETETRINMLDLHHWHMDLPLVFVHWKIKDNNEEERVCSVKINCPNSDKIVVTQVVPPSLPAWYVEEYDFVSEHGFYYNWKVHDSIAADAWIPGKYGQGKLLSSKKVRVGLKDSGSSITIGMYCAADNTGEAGEEQDLFITLMDEETVSIGTAPIPTIDYIEDSMGCGDTQTLSSSDGNSYCWEVEGYGSIDAEGSSVTYTVPDCGTGAGDCTFNDDCTYEGDTIKMTDCEGTVLASFTVHINCSSDTSLAYRETTHCEDRRIPYTVYQKYYYFDNYRCNGEYSHTGRGGCMDGAASNCMAAAVPHTSFMVCDCGATYYSGIPACAAYDPIGCDLSSLYGSEGYVYDLRSTPYNGCCPAALA